MGRARLIRDLFRCVVALGLGVVFVAFLVAPALPFIQLDAVLTPEELRDPKVREQTLALLRRAQGNQVGLWTLLGATLVAIGALGLRTTARLVAEWAPIRRG